MSSDPFTTATELAVLSSGRTPVWTTQDDAGSLLPPSTGIMGVPLQDAVRALVHVALREDAHHRTARLTIPVVDLTCTYTVTIDGTAVAYVAAAANLQVIVDGIAAAINANGTVNVIVAAEAYAVSGSGSRDAVRVYGIVERDWSITFAQSDAATVACVADYCLAQLRLWWMPGARVGSTPPAVWAWSGEHYELDRRGIVQRFDSAGLDRLCLQVSDRAGHSADGPATTFRAPVLSIGPCLDEAA